jgi:hypothetical protein
MRYISFLFYYCIVVTFLFSFEIIEKSYEENPEKILKPISIDIDNSGNVYLIDYFSGKTVIYDKNFNFIEKIEGLDMPSSIMTDRDKIYFVETGKNRVTIYNSDLKNKISYGSIGMVQGKFNRPGNIYKIGNEIYVTDEYNFRIQIFNDKMEYLREIILPKFSIEYKPFYNSNYSLTELDGRLYILDGHNKKVYKYYKGKIEKRISISSAGVNDIFTYSGKVYIFNVEKGVLYDVLNTKNKIDTGIKDNFSIVKFGKGKLKDGKYYFVSKNSIYCYDFKLKKSIEIKKLFFKTPDEYIEPCDIKKDEYGNIYVVDKADGRVIIYDEKWNYKRDINIGGGISGISIDQFGNIYSALAGENKINKYENSGKLIYSYGKNDIKSNPDLKRNRLENIGNLKVLTDKDGYIYVLDSLDYKVKKFDQFFNLKVEAGKKAGVLSIIKDKKESGTFGWDEIKKDNLSDFAVYKNKIYILDNYYGRVNLFEESKFKQELNDNFSKNGLNGIFIKNDKIYIADSYNFKISIYSLDLKKIKEISFLEKGLIPLKIYEELVICEKITDSFNKKYIIVKLKENEL